MRFDSWKSVGERNGEDVGREDFWWGGYCLQARVPVPRRKVRVDRPDASAHASDPDQVELATVRFLRSSVT